ncbi:hypothetical protein KQ874_01450 [Mycoplasma sp. ES3157-GEN-MYC]|uniref:Uncharacterized protein n=1 Tax=Mycoplasma miroungigenitalium TaxID=754515 RepID=A0A6M4JAM4_9MOLU|nr:hypothetical protein [Mycoplasma miroungigenitalium]MBU4690353.1 hypothetical protein [Mycoplasma miroungigenitalium]MBU4691620.1 hypothetical protein [Mycoplasma miroungigenitalium]QJR43445.1 hypothetical protein HLA87_01435 [Mycoplasma miroungigenitalium]
MTKLTKLTKWFWIYLVVITLLSIFVFYFVLTYKIEKTIKVNFIVDEKKNLVLLAPEKSLFYIDKNKEISINYDNKIYLLKVSAVKKINENVLVTFYKLPRNMRLIPNTHIEGVLYYDKSSILSNFISLKY